MAQAFAESAEAAQTDIAGQLAKIDRKSDAAKLLARLVRQASAPKAVANMAEFFAGSEFGRALSAVAQKTTKLVRGQAVYKATEKVGSYIKRGDQFYLDALHKDHLEVFSSNGTLKHVLNLDDTLNNAKTAAARGRRI